MSSRLNTSPFSKTVYYKTFNTGWLKTDKKAFPCMCLKKMSKSHVNTKGPGTRNNNNNNTKLATIQCFSPWGNWVMSASTLVAILYLVFLSMSEDRILQQRWKRWTSCWSKILHRLKNMSGKKRKRKERERENVMWMRFMWVGRDAVGWIRQLKPVLGNSTPKSQAQGMVLFIIHHVA